MSDFNPAEFTPNLEPRVRKLEERLAVVEQRDKEIIFRLEKIETTLTRVNWLIVSAIAAGMMGFIMKGGLVLPG